MSAPAIQRTLPVWFLNQVIANAGVVTSGRLGLHQFVNGALRGSLNAPALGTFTILQEAVAGAGGMTVTVTRDATLPGFQYPFLVAIFEPFLTLTFTDTGGGGTIRGAVSAVPLF